MVPQHSFGGHALDRYLFDYETVMEGEAASAGVDPAAEPVGDVQAETEGVPSPEPATPTEAAPSIDWAAPEARQAITAGTVEALQAFVASQQAAAQAAQQEQDEAVDWENLDPFDGQQLAQAISAAVKGELAPVQKFLEQQAAREQAQVSQEWTTRQFEELKIPEEDRGIVLYTAGGLEQAAISGGFQVDGGQVMKLAHQQLQDHDKRVGDKAVEAYIASLKAVEDAPRTPGSAVTAVEGLPADEDELAVARRIIAARNAA